jgi:amino acid transporter
MSREPSPSPCTETPSGLVRALGRLDTMLFVITAVVVLDTIGAVAVGGPEAFTWLALMGVAFLVPSALLTAELGAAFPAEGGHYVWTRLAFGRVAGAVSALLYWIETPIWIGGSLAITAIAVTEEFLSPLGHGGRLAFALAFVWIAVGAAVLPIRLGRFVPASGAVARVALVALFSGTVLVYAAVHGVHGIAAGELEPTRAGLAALVPVLLYNYLGFDVPSAAAGEMRDPQRDLPAAILRAGAWTFVLYAVPVLATLLVLPADRITGLTGFVSAIREVFTVYGPAGGALGGVAGLLLIWVLVTSGATWLMASARSQAVACLDGAGPRRLGVFSARGTPARLAVVSGVVASGVSLATFSVAGSSAERYFAVALSLSIAVIALSYVAIFAAPVRLRRTHPHVARPFRVPGGTVGLWACSALSLGWTVAALGLLLWPPELPAAFQGDRATFQLTQVVPLVLLVACGLAFASLGRRASVAGARAGLTRE